MLRLPVPALRFSRQSLGQKSKEAASPSSPRFHSYRGPIVTVITAPKGVSCLAPTGISKQAKKKKSHTSIHHSLHSWTRKLKDTTCSTSPSKSPTTYKMSDLRKKVCTRSVISQCPSWCLLSVLPCFMHEGHSQPSQSWAGLLLSRCPGSGKTPCRHRIADAARAEAARERGLMARRHSCTPGRLTAGSGVCTNRGQSQHLAKAA